MHFRPAACIAAELRAFEFIDLDEELAETGRG
jgi:hypothetical protein